jgi:hypothetical protein
MCWHQHKELRCAHVGRLAIPQLQFVFFDFWADRKSLIFGVRDARGLWKPFKKVGGFAPRLV